MFLGSASGVTFSRYCGPGLSGRRRGKSSRGTGRRPFEGSRGSRIGWYGSGTSTKAGDSGGIYCLMEEVVKVRVGNDNAVFFTWSRSRQARHTELDRDSMVNLGVAGKRLSHAAGLSLRNRCWCTETAVELMSQSRRESNEREPKKKTELRNIAPFPIRPPCLGVQRLIQNFGDASFCSSDCQHKL